MRESVHSNALSPRLVGGLRRHGRRPGPVILVMTALILLAFAATPGEALAARHAGRPTVLHVSVTDTVGLGGHAIVTVRLTAAGKPVRGQLISIRLDGKVSQRVKTGADGKATADIARDLSAPVTTRCLPGSPAPRRIDHQRAGRLSSL